MRYCDNDILDWFRLSFMGKNRRFQFEQSSDITFHVSSVKRKLVIKLSSSMASDVSSGSHVSMDNLLGIDFEFWPPKPVMITNTPEPIVEVVLRTNEKKRALKPFSELKERQKRKRLADHRLRVNEVMSVKKSSDIDQSEMLRHYSN